jgi:hypothetical protein
MNNYNSKALLEVGSRTERKENGLLIQVGTFGLISRSEKFWKKFKCGEILAKKVPKEENELAGTKGLKKLLKEILGVKPYVGFWLCDIYSKDGKPIGRKPIREVDTYKKLVSFALKNGYTVLKRGFFFIPKAVWKDYKENYKKGDHVSNLRTGLAVFREERLTRLAPYILMDFDNTPEEDIKRLVSYLYKLGIYPDVWQSASGNGYHIYIKLIGNYVTKYDIVKEKKIKTVYRFLPYASDYRIELCEKALKELCKRLNIKYDFISSKHAVFEEGIPNPLKGGRASKKVRNGKEHMLDKLTEKLRPLWEARLREEAWEKFLKSLRKPKKRQEERGYARIEIQASASSNPIDYLQANISATFRMLDRGYTWAEIEEELRNHWEGDPKAFDRAFRGFQSWIEDHYKPLKTTRRKPPKQRKHKHYWEYVDAIYEVLRQNPTASIREIAKATGIPKSSIGDILKLFTREQILADPEQVKSYFKANEKGGDRLTEEAKEELREKGKERFRKYFEDFLKQVLRPKPKTKGERKNRIQDSITYKEAVITLDLSDQESVRIGSISITLPKGESREQVDGLCPPTPKNDEKTKKNVTLSVSSVSSCLSSTFHDPQALRRINALLDLVKEVFLGNKPLPEPKMEMIKAIGYSGTFTPAPLWQEMATWCYAELLKRDIVALDGTKFDEEKLEKERPDIVEKLLELFHLIAKRHKASGTSANEPSTRDLNERTTNDAMAITEEPSLKTTTDGTPASEGLSSETETETQAKGYGAPRGRQKVLFTFPQTGQTSTAGHQNGKTKRSQETQKQTDDEKEIEELWNRYYAPRFGNSWKELVEGHLAMLKRFQEGLERWKRHQEELERLRSSGELKRILMEAKMEAQREVEEHLKRKKTKTLNGEKSREKEDDGIDWSRLDQEFDF